MAHIIASLTTSCGLLQMFSLEALEVALAKISAIPTQAGNLSDQAPAPLPQPVQLLDGFTINQWAAYAKLNSQVASRMCHENGLMKRKLASWRAGAPLCLQALLLRRVTQSLPKIRGKQLRQSLQHLGIVPPALQHPRKHICGLIGAPQPSSTTLRQSQHPHPAISKKAALALQLNAALTRSTAAAIALTLLHQAVPLAVHTLLATSPCSSMPTDKSCSTRRPRVKTQAT